MENNPELSPKLESTVQDLRNLIFYKALEYSEVREREEHETRNAVVFPQGKAYLHPRYVFTLFPETPKALKKNEGKVGRLNIKNRDRHETRITLMDNGGVHYQKINERDQEVESGMVDDNRARHLLDDITPMIDHYDSQAREQER